MKCILHSHVILSDIFKHQEESSERSHEIKIWLLDSSQEVLLNYGVLSQVFSV